MFLLDESMKYIFCVSLMICQRVSVPMTFKVATFMIKLV